MGVVRIRAAAQWMDKPTNQQTACCYLVRMRACLHVVTCLVEARALLEEVGLVVEHVQEAVEVRDLWFVFVCLGFGGVCCWMVAGDGACDMKSTSPTHIPLTNPTPTHPHTYTSTQTPTHEPGGVASSPRAPADPRAGRAASRARCSPGSRRPRRPSPVSVFVVGGGFSRG